MAEGSSIGAAAPYVLDKGSPKFSEKMTSAFSASFRALAEKHKRPTAIAGAMVDPDMELREVTVKGRRQFLAADRAEELAADGAQLGPWVTRKGKLLTLTAREAEGLGMADGVVSSRDDLLAALGCQDARVADLQTTRVIVRPFARELDRQARSALRKAVDCDYPDKSGFFSASPTRVGQIDLCLSVCRKLLDLGRRYPVLEINTGALRQKIARLRRWREKPSGRY